MVFKQFFQKPLKNSSTVFSQNIIQGKKITELRNSLKGFSKDYLRNLSMDSFRKTCTDCFTMLNVASEVSRRILEKYGIDCFT